MLMLEYANVSDAEFQGPKIVLDSDSCEQRPKILTRKFRRQTVQQLPSLIRIIFVFMHSHLHKMRCHCKDKVHA